MDMDRTPQFPHTSQTSHPPPHHLMLSYSEGSPGSNSVKASGNGHLASQNHQYQGSGGEQVSCHSHPYMPLVVDASYLKKQQNGKSMVGSDHPEGPRVPLQQQQHSLSQQMRQLGADRERMKDMMADSFSRHETISILPGYKESGSGARTVQKPCIKMASQTNNNPNYVGADKPPSGIASLHQPWKIHENPVHHPHYYQQQQQCPPTGMMDGHNRMTPPTPQKEMMMMRKKGPNQGAGDGSGNNCSSNNSSSHNSLLEPWPYKGQKSQRAIREAQAAYKRDLDKQIEEKRMNQSHTRNSNSKAGGKTSEKTELRPVNQSISLEAFRNTGFLPPWFDPVSNNTLYNNTNKSNPNQGPEVASRTRSENEISGTDDSQSRDQQQSSQANHMSNSHKSHQQQLLSEQMVQTSTNQNCAVEAQPSQMLYSSNPSPSPSPLTHHTITNVDGSFFIVTQDMMNQWNSGQVKLQNFPMYSPYNSAPPNTQHVQQKPPSNQMTHMSQETQVLQQQLLSSGAGNNSTHHQPHHAFHHDDRQAPSAPTTSASNSTMTSVHMSQIQHPANSNNNNNNGSPAGISQMKPPPSPPLPQQSTWTPWLSLNSSGYALNLRNFPPPPTPPSFRISSSGSPRGEPSSGNSMYIQETPPPTSAINSAVATSTSSAAGTNTSAISQMSDEHLHHKHQQAAHEHPMELNSSMIGGSEDNGISSVLVGHTPDAIDLCPEGGDGNLEGVSSPRISSNNCVSNDKQMEDFVGLIPHVSQTSNQLPDEEVLRQRYKSELAKQIQEKKRLEQERVAKQEEEEAKLQRKLELDQQRMLEEYEQEQSRLKIKQEEYKKRQEIILKEKERFDRLAEEDRQRKKIERRKSLIAASHLDPPENTELLLNSNSNKSSEDAYESGTDMTVCAASRMEIQATERPNSPVQSSTGSDQSPTSGSPRPRTVVISHHRPSVEPEAFPQPAHPASEPSPFSNSSDDDKLKSHVSFLSNFRKALVAEDRRIGKIIKKKERFFVTI